jgi:hypothetical protein
MTSADANFQFRSVGCAQDKGGRKASEHAVRLGFATAEAGLRKPAADFPFPGYARVTGDRAGFLAGRLRQTGSDRCSADRTIDSHLDPSGAWQRSRTRAEPSVRRPPEAQAVDLPRNNRHGRNSRLTSSAAFPTVRHGISHRPPSPSVMHLKHRQCSNHPVLRRFHAGAGGRHAC